MAQGLIADILAWISAHPNAALTVVFAIAFGESLFLFGLLIPGAIFMFAFGALIGSDVLSATATFTIAIVGTLAGDSVSYVLGRYYRGRLHDLPGLSRIPGGVARGEAFFVRHGGKAIVLGRLIGALRPVMPTVAGAAGLSVARFTIMEIIATALWAPIYIGPGIVFGASLDLAAQVATRLAILLIGTAAIIWIVTSLARLIVVTGATAGRRYAEQLMQWSQRHRRLGLLGPALADPRQPEVPALGVAAAVLLTVVAGLYSLLWGWHEPSYPSAFDAVVFYLLSHLYNAPTDLLARLIAEIGSPLIYLPFAVAVAVTLSVMGNRRAAAHWIVAVAFSAIVTLILRGLLGVAPPASFFHVAPIATPVLAGGGQDLILCATIYGLAGMIVGARQPEAIRPYCYSATVAGVVLIALARLYLGLDWASDSLLGLSAAFVWINLLMIGYRRQRPRRVQGRPVLAALGGCVLFAALLALIPGSALRDLPAGFDAQHEPPRVTIDDWTGRGYLTLPDTIRTLRGRGGAPLNIQAAGTRQALIDLFTRAGWQEPPELGAGGALRSLAPETPIHALPVLPRVHDGHRAGLVFVHPARNRATRRWVIRLWPTRYITAGERQPIWVGLVDAQRIGHDLHMVTTARDEGGYRLARDFLARSLATHGLDYRVSENTAHSPLLIWSHAVGVDAKVAPR